MMLHLEASVLMMSFETKIHHQHLQYFLSQHQNLEHPLKAG